MLGQFYATKDAMQLYKLAPRKKESERREVVLVAKDGIVSLNVYGEGVYLRRNIPLVEGADAPADFIHRIPSAAIETAAKTMSKTDVVFFDYSRLIIRGMATDAQDGETAVIDKATVPYQYDQQTELFTPETLWGDLDSYTGNAIMVPAKKLIQALQQFKWGKDETIVEIRPGANGQPMKVCAYHDEDDNEILGGVMPAVR